MTRIPFIPRAADEQILDMLALRDSGLTSVQIAERMGLTKGVVTGALFRVDRDLAASEAQKVRKGKATASREQIVMAFWHRGRNCFAARTAEEVAKRSGVDVLRLKRRLSNLAADGWAEKKAHNVNGTLVPKWHLTPKGEKAARTLMQAAEVERSA